MAVKPGGDTGDELLFARPGSFRVDYEINPYMRPGVDQDRARRQWEDTVETVRSHADVEVVDYGAFVPAGGAPLDRLPDAVFCANHALTLPGEDAFVLARMAHEERADEIPYFERWANKYGYETLDLGSDVAFEGAGDGKWHPGRDRLWVGYGQRTDEDAVPALSDLLDVEVRGLELVSEHFYHLDVCFTPLDRETVLVVEEAFTAAGIDAIESEFSTVLRVPESELETMAGNCSRIAPETVAIDSQNSRTAELLEDHGYDVVTVETSEFQKSGGSIDCLFLRLP